MISEFAISKPTTNLFDRAQELGFVAYAFKDPDSSSFDHNEFWMEKNESKNIALQKRLDEMKHGYLEIQIRPWPPFLRWIIDFQVESGIVKSVSRSQLD